MNVRHLGDDPVTGHPVLVKKGPYGLYLQKVGGGREGDGHGGWGEREEKNTLTKTLENRQKLAALLANKYLGLITPGRLDLELPDS
jgi:topoisomerase IA-like protein